MNRPTPCLAPLDATAPDEESAGTSPALGPPLSPQSHGGDRKSMCEALGVDDLADYSASINPLGTPAGLLEAVTRAWTTVGEYPQPEAPTLRAALAAHHGVAPRNVVVGNGSAELIDLLCRIPAPRRVVTAPPDFSLYHDLLPAELPRIEIPRREEEGFLPQTDRIGEILETGDLLVFSNPGNPAGTALDPDRVLGLADRAAEAGALVVVDEAFADFCPEVSVVGQTSARRNLVVLRSMTKFYGIPGLRLGYAVGPASILGPIQAAQVPWSVNTLAQAAGLHCLADRTFEDRTLAAVAQARADLARRLDALPGLSTIPSRTNYLLVRLAPPAPPASALYDALARRGFLVRHCASFGLGERYLRMAVHLPAQNRALVEAMTQSLQALESSSL